MSFEPEPGTRIHLKNDEVIEFLPLEANGPASVFVYAESGKEGTVYKVLKDKEQFALKVFYPQYRDKRLLENTDKLSRFKNLEGFRVAKRTVITPEAFPNLLNKYPDLQYAVLMPWIDGTVWGNLMLETDPSLQLENYVQIAYALTRVVSSLELQGLAHCDLSNNNFIIAKSPSGIQLIDIEDMYAPDMPRPIPDVSYGSIGYRTKWIAERGLWGPESDRFSIAVLCSEIISWHNEEIRENRAGNTSFFDEEEIGEECDRYKLMIQHLGSESDELPDLLERAWFSSEFSDCPTVLEWTEAVRKRQLQMTPEPSPYMEDQANIATIIMRKSDRPNLMLVEPALEPEPALVDEVEEGPSQLPTIDLEKTEDEITVDMPDQASLESEAEDTSELEDQLQQEAVVLEESDGAMPIGLPPKMNISLEILDFGILGKPENTQRFSISNTGGANLTVTIQTEQWVDISPQDFTLTPGEQQLIIATINAKFPKPKTGREYRTPSAMTVESNIGSEVIGAKLTLARPAFHESGWKRALLGAMLGLIVGIILLPSAGSDGIGAMLAIMFLGGLMAFIAYPGK